MAGKERMTYISKSPTPQSQSVEGTMRKKRVENKGQRAAHANKEAFTLLFKPAIHRRHTVEYSVTKIVP